MAVERENNVIATSYKTGDVSFTCSSLELTGPQETNDTYGTEYKKEVSESSRNPLKNMADYIRNLFRNTKVVVHLLVCAFAIASWIDINGMWAELPLLVEKAKEGWTLPSYIIIISQIANIGPLIFVLVSYLAPQTKPKLEKVTSFIIIIISMAASFLLAFLWERTTYVGGTEHSTALLALNFFLAVGDCTSSVSFYAFMAHLKPEYMASLFIGEGLSGLLPALIALGQGAGEIRCNGTQSISTEPDFSVRIYFIILSAVIAVSAVAFLLLNFWGYCRSEMVHHASADLEKSISQAKQSSVTYGTLKDQGSEDAGDLRNVEERGYIGPYCDEDDQEDKVDSHELAQDSANRNGLATDGSITVETSDRSAEDTSTSPLVMKLVQVHDIPMWKFFLLLAIIIIINMTLTSFLSTIQIYSVLPYGLEYYHLTTTLPQIANPVACFFALFVMAEKLVVIIIVTFLGQICVGYIIYVAAVSPDPPLQGSSDGGALIVAIWVLVTLLLVYAKVCIAGVLRKHGRNALIWGGASTQFGALIGAIVGFVLVNEYTLFAEAPYCK